MTTGTSAWSTQSRVQQASGETVTRQHVRQLARDVLDGLMVTDLVYHDLSFSEPLVVDVLWRLLNRTPPDSRVLPRDGRVLMVGGNLYLGAAIVELGFGLDILTLGDAPVAAELHDHIVGSISQQDPLAGLPGQAVYSAIILPLVIEHVDVHVTALLQACSTLLTPEGRVILATANLGRLGLRLRALLGRGFLPDSRHAPAQTRGGWTSLPQFRLFQPEEVRAWSAEVGLAVDDCAYSLGQEAAYQALPLSLGAYVALQARHVVKVLVPSLRDCAVMTLRVMPPPLTPKQLPSLAEYRAWIPDQDGQTSLPFVSVVVFSRQGGDLLRTALRALLAQTYPADKYEIVVAADGSDDELGRVIDQTASPGPSRIRRVRIDNPLGPAAYNQTMRLVEGDIIAYLDEDCEATPGWIEAGVLGFEQNVPVVSGPIILKPGERPGGFDWSTAYLSDNGTYPVSNVFYRREAALAVGGFDEGFTPRLSGDPGRGWDSDLAWRLLRQGYEARFRDAYGHARVRRQDPWHGLLAGWRQGYRTPSLVRAIPELRARMLFRTFFHSGDSLAFDIAVLGTALACLNRRPSVLVLWLPWLQRALQRVGWDSRPPRVPPLDKLVLLFLLHAFTAAGLACGSVRFRRLVL